MNRPYKNNYGNTHINLSWLYFYHGPLFGIRNYLKSSGPSSHPLMSATNAISGISLVASLIMAGGKYGTVSTVLGAVAVTCATINVVGGFLITDRMLKMFRKKQRK